MSFRFRSVTEVKTPRPLRMTGHEVGAEGDERLAGMAGSRAPNDFCCFGVQRGVQREGAVTVVLESVSLGSAGSQRQYRIQPVQRLNAGLFINAENDCMLRRFLIQSTHITRLLPENRFNPAAFASPSVC